MTAVQNATFREKLCIPFLLDCQNSDGGWGFQPGASSRVESTCWALHALNGQGREFGAHVNRGREFLRAVQRTDGSWPAMADGSEGSWVTSLACWVLLADQQSWPMVKAGLHWTCSDWPRDSAPLLRFLRKLTTARNDAPMNDSLRGWGWTPRTSSWVEPTAYALLALQKAPLDLLPRNAHRRQALGEALLYDRMCPGGGWNCGNPMVYGVAGEPLVIPTAWALLALRRLTNTEKKALSLSLLQKISSGVESSASLALIRIVYAAYSLAWPGDDRRLEDFCTKSDFMKNTQVAAWACLASTADRHWLEPVSGACA